MKTEIYAHLKFRKYLKSHRIWKIGYATIYPNVRDMWKEWLHHQRRKIQRTVDFVDTKIYAESWDRMTKAELQKDRDEWKQQAESLQDDLDSLNEAYSELEATNYKLSNKMDTNSIYDLEDFIFRLKVDDLYTDELGKFIEDYMRFYNRKE